MDNDKNLVEKCDHSISKCYGRWIINSCQFCKKIYYVEFQNIDGTYIRFTPTLEDLEHLKCLFDDW